MIINLRKIHLWTGLSLGLFLVVLSLTGVILMYQSAILSTWHPELNTTGNTSDSLTADVLTLANHHSWDESDTHKITMIQVPQFPEFHYQIKSQSPHGQRIDYIDPNTLSKVLSRSNEDDFILWIFQLHSHLLSGDSGEQMLGVLASLSVLLIVSGLWVWWPGRRRLKQHITVPRTKNSTAWLMWFHRTSGILIAPLLLIAVFTGLGMVYFTPIKSTLIAITASQPTASPQFTMNCPLEAQRFNWQQQVQRVRSTYPEASIIRVYPSHSPTKPNRFRLKFAEEWHQNGRTYVYINPCNNEVVYAHDARKDALGAQLANMMYPIHSVHVGGVLFKGLMTIAALTPPALFITGLITWSRRSRKYKPAKKH